MLATQGAGVNQEQMMRMLMQQQQQQQQRDGQQPQKVRAQVPPKPALATPEYNMPHPASH